MTTKNSLKTLEDNVYLCSRYEEKYTYCRSGTRDGGRLRRRLPERSDADHHGLRGEEPRLGSVRVVT